MKGVGKPIICRVMNHEEKKGDTGVENKQQGRGRGDRGRGGGGGGGGRGVGGSGREEGGGAGKHWKHNQLNMRGFSTQAAPDRFPHHQPVESQQEKFLSFDSLHLSCNSRCLRTSGDRERERNSFVDDGVCCSTCSYCQYHKKEAQNQLET